MACSKNSDSILETDRLILRELTCADIEALSLILQDKETMHAYEHAFDDMEVRDWLDRQLHRYQNDGFGLWAVILRESGEFIGQCGITLQECKGASVHEVGYLFRRAFWHKGYATEAAKACKRHAFENPGISELYAIIRDTNTASRKVAERLGMEHRGTLVKHYYGMTMPHDIFSIRRTDLLSGA